MEYRILGPLEVRRDGSPVRIGGAQQRAVLAALLLRASRVVSVERLVELLWGERPPGRARTLVHGCVARLRRDLREPGDDCGALLTLPPGYLLRVRPGELDLDRFTALATGAEGDDDQAGRLRAALALCRGPVLADIQLPAIRAAATGLDERVAAVLEDRIELDLLRGRLDGLVAELSVLVREHPLRERLWAQLMVARCAGGQPAEALAAYRELRGNLIDQLGMEPGERLRRLERAILSDEDVWAVYRPEQTPVRPAATPRPPSPAPALVGRSAEVGKLRTALDDLTRGSVLVGVAGDPGIGKTRLLAELATLARRQGRLVLSGQAAEFEQDAPFAVVKNVLEDQLRTMDPARLAGLAPAERGLLRAVFPAITAYAAAGGGADTTLIAAERYRLHRAIRTQLDLLAEPAGLVLILDDLHWCDDGSAELLAHLLRHPPAGPVLLAFAYRPRQLNARLHHEVVAATRRRSVTVIDVGPLTFAEATALLPKNLDTDHRRRLYAAGEGNPCYLDLLSRGTAGEEVPAAVGAALAGEFGRLAVAEQRVAQAAALAGDVVDSRSVDSRLIAVIAGLPEPDTLDAIDELGRRDLIRRRGTSFTFRHPLLRRAAYHQAPPGWRVAAHRRAADELARRGSSLPAPARHAALSPGPDGHPGRGRDILQEIRHLLPPGTQLEHRLRAGAGPGLPAGRPPGPPAAESSDARPAEGKAGEVCRVDARRNLFLNGGGRRFQDASQIPSPPARR